MVTMDNIWQILEGGLSVAPSFTAETVLLSLLLAFVLGQVLAWVYYFTHSGLSYSRSFVQSLIIITVVIALVMAVIQTSFVTAVGLMGALAIIRFRNIIKDTRDIAFIFCSLVVGMASGSQRYAVAVVGTIVLSLIIVYLHVADFGTHQPHNGFLRFTFTGHIESGSTIFSILERFCGRFTLVSAQDSGLGTSEVEYAYQVMIRNTARNQEMLSALQDVEGLENISLTMQERLLEV